MKKVDTEIENKTYVRLDSGASEHVVNKMEYLSKVEQVPKLIAELANGNVLS